MKFTGTILIAVAFIVVLFIVLKSKAQNVLGIGDITSVNGDFSSDFTNLGRILNRFSGGTSSSSGYNWTTPTSGPSSSQSTGGTTHQSCYVNANGETRCREVGENCEYRQPNGKNSLYLCCSGSCVRIY